MIISKKGGAMDEDYLIERAKASLAMARRAAGSAARLVHFDLAGRYVLAAARLEPGDGIGSRATWVGASSFHDDAKPLGIVGH